MKNKFTTLVIIAVLLFGAYTSVNVFLSNFLSVPRLKGILIKPVEKALARNVEVGEIQVSLFKGIHITNLVVKDQNPENDLASIDSCNLDYELLPLFKGKLVIKSVQINNPKLNIIKNKKGVFNLATFRNAGPLKAKHEEQEEEYFEPLPLSLNFENIAVNKATVTLTDLTDELPNFESNADASFSMIIGENLASTSFNGTMTLLANGTYKEQKPVLMLEGKFNQKSFDFKGNISMGFERLAFNGLLNNYTSNPDIKLIIKSSKLNLDNIIALISSDKSSEKQDAAELAPAIDPLTESEQITSTGTDPAPTIFAAPETIPLAEADTESASEPSPGPVAIAETETVPVAQPAKFSILGQIVVAELSNKKFIAGNINLFYSFKDNVVTLKNVSVNTFGGALTSSNITVDLNQKEPAISGDIKTEKIQISELLKNTGKTAENLSGALSSNFVFTGTGMNWDVLQNTLCGNGDYTLSDGGMSTPITSALAMFLDIPELSNLQYKDISGFLKIINGNLLLNASLTGSQFDMTSEGKIGLNGTLDLPLNLYLSQEYSHKLREKSSYSNYLADDQGRVTLHLLLNGSTSEPKIRLDEKEAVYQVKAVVVEKADEELERVISRELGVSTEEGNIVKGLSENYLNEMFKK